MHDLFSYFTIVKIEKLNSRFLDSFRVYNKSLSNNFNNLFIISWVLNVNCFNFSESQLKSRVYCRPLHDTFSHSLSTQWIFFHLIALSLNISFTSLLYRATTLLYMLSQNYVIFAMKPPTFLIILKSIHIKCSSNISLVFHKKKKKATFYMFMKFLYTSSY